MNDISKQCEKNGYQSVQVDLVSESEELIVQRVEHLWEVSALKQLVLSNHHLQHMTVN